jgi:hypothetical protein
MSAKAMILDHPKDVVPFECEDRNKKARKPEISAAVALPPREPSNLLWPQYIGNHTPPSRPVRNSKAIVSLWTIARGS